MTVTEREIDHLAKLTRLQLSSEEKHRYAEDMARILDFVDQLKKVDKLTTDTAKAALRLTDLSVERQTPRDSLSLDDIKKLAPNFSTSDNQIVVPAVLKENDQ